MTRALFVMSIPNYTREVGPVVDHFGRKGIDVHVLIGWSDASTDAYEAACRDAGFVVHHVPEHLKYHPASPAADDSDLLTPTPAETVPPTRRLRRRIGLVLYEKTRLWWAVRRSREKKRFGRHLIAETQPNVVFASSYGDTTNSFDQAISKAVRAAGIPYYCVPNSPNLGEKGAIQSRFNWLGRSDFLDAWLVDRSFAWRLIAWFFPAWTRTVGDSTLFRFDPIDMLAARLTGMISKNPWQIPSELFDAVFVESDFSRDLLLESGYDEAKLVVSGKPLLDAVFSQLDDRAHTLALYAALGLEPDTPFLLYNVEPSAEHAYASWSEHWDRFRSNMDQIAESGLEVVLSLHPLCDPKDYAFVEEEYGFGIAQQKIVELYPYCGIVVSFPCSTNVLNLVFDKPLVIYDFFGLTRPEAVGNERLRLPGARIAYDPDAVLASVRELVAAPATGSERDAVAQTAACETILQYVRARAA